MMVGVEVSASMFTGARKWKISLVPLGLGTFFSQILQWCQKKGCHVVPSACYHPPPLPTNFEASRTKNKTTVKYKVYNSSFTLNFGLLKIFSCV